jgi:hypothetical protein
MNNPITYVDPSGEIAYPGQIHNAVVNHIQMKYAVSGMQKNKMIDYRFGFGYADLVNVITGEVWEVKRNTLSVPKALQQLIRYTTNRLHDKKYSEIQLVTGGSKGTFIYPDSFVMTANVDTYYIDYWDKGNGIIQYDYYKITDWQEVGEIATGAVVVAGVTCAIIVTEGAAAPVLVPLFVK